MTKIKLKTLAPPSATFIETLLIAFFLFRAGEVFERSDPNFFHNGKKTYAKFIERYMATKKHIKCLQDFADDFGYQVQLWVKNGNKKEPFLIQKINTLFPRGVLNIDCPNSNELQGLILTGASLIMNWDEYAQSSNRKSIFKHLAEHVCQSEKAVLNKWDSNTVHFFDERKFHQVFGVGFQIIQSSLRKHRHYSYKMVYRSLFKEYLTLEFGKNWLENKQFIDKNDLFVLKQNLNFLICKTQNCGIITTNKKFFETHTISCTGQTKYQFKQAVLTDDSARGIAIRRGYLDANFQPRFFVSYDIETLADKNMDLRSASATTELNCQRLLSIALTKNFGDKRSVALIREEITENGYYDLLLQFKQNLFSIHDEFRASIPIKIWDSINEIKAKILHHRQTDEKLSVPEFDELTKCLYFLQKMTCLPVVGFNSEHFDLPILLPGILKIWGMKKVGVIKRGCGIMSMELSPFLFLDVRNFIAGSNLINFGKTWNANAEKSIFPYEFFNSLDQLNNAFDWPPYDSFKSSLRLVKQTDFIEKLKESLVRYEPKLRSFGYTISIFLEKQFNVSTIDEVGHDKIHWLCPDEYIENFLGYLKLRHDGKIKNMSDYLLHYNIKDTELLSEGFTNYCDKFIETFNISPLNYLSLPAMAETVMWRNYDCENNKAYSFSDQYGHISELIRENLQGGLVAVFHRHAAVDMLATGNKIKV